MATSTFTQLPGELSLEFIQGDELAVALDFDRDLTGFQIETKIYVTAVYASGLGGAGSVETVGETAATFTIQNTDLAAGQITIGLTEAQTALLSPSVAYRWYMRWVDTTLFTRTVLSGTVTVRNP